MSSHVPAGSSGLCSSGSSSPESSSSMPTYVHTPRSIKRCCSSTQRSTLETSSYSSTFSGHHRSRAYISQLSSRSSPRILSWRTCLGEGGLGICPPPPQRKLHQDSPCCQSDPRAGPSESPWTSGVLWQQPETPPERFYHSRWGPPGGRACGRPGPGPASSGCGRWSSPAPDLWSSSAGTGQPLSPTHNSDSSSSPLRRPNTCSAGGGPVLGRRTPQTATTL